MKFILIIFFSVTLLIGLFFFSSARLLADNKGEIRPKLDEPKSEMKKKGTGDEYDKEWDPKMSADWKKSDEQKKYKPTFWGVFLSVLPGSVVHGLGNLYRKETSDGLNLLYMEGAGLLLLGSGLGAYFASEPGSAWKKVSFPLMITGGALFLFSWLFDIIGVSAGRVIMDENTIRQEGISVWGFYRNTTSYSGHIDNYIVMKFSFNNRWVIVEPEVDFDLNFNKFKYGLMLACKLYRFRNDKNTFFSLNLEGFREDAFADKYNINSFNAYLHIQLNMSHLLKSIIGIYLYSKLGYGYSFVNYWGNSHLGFFDFQSRLPNVIGEIGLMFNVTQSLTLFFGHSYRYDEMIGQLPDNIGAFRFGLNYRSFENSQIKVQIDLGNLFMLWIGMSYYFK